MKDGEDPQLAAALAELAQVKRWFDVLDSQMQVLDRERQKLAAVVSQSDTPMFSANAEQRVQWGNAAFRAEVEGSERVAGRTVQEVWELLGVDTPPACVARALSEGAVAHTEAWCRRGGATRALYVTALPIKDKEARTAEILVMIQDISDLDLIRRSEARYRLLFERSPDAMVMAALDSGKILLANRAASALTEYGAEELAAMDLEQLHEPGTWPSSREAYARMASQEGAGHTERELRTRQGRPIVAKVTATRFDLDDRTATLLVLQDVTIQRKLEAELRHSQKMEVVGRLAAGVTHEFNNIMTVILAGAEMLKLRAGQDESLCEIADTTEKAAHRAALLTRQLLGFSRKDLVRDDTLDLNEVIRGIEGLLGILLGERVSLHIAVAAEPCHVRGDRTQLEEVVFNLAANARDAMPSGGNLRLEVSHGAAGEVQLAARDDGSGMDAETRARLFEPFFTTKAPHEGTGLGMSTILDIVQRHGGTIEVESEPGRGTFFLVRLPGVGRSDATAEAGPLPSQRPRGAERILVVDDRGEVLRAAVRLLNLEGYQVESATSAEEALALLEQASFHLVVTDVVMPGMSGVELAGCMERRFPGTRVLFMSAYTDREAGVAEGDLLRKPFSRSALAQKVRDVLDRRE